MFYRFFFILSCFFVLAACSKSSDDTKKEAMAGYKLPTTIDVLETQE